MIDLTVMKTHREEVETLQGWIADLYQKTNEELLILEAGCGRKWPLNLGLVNYKLIGVDLDKKALESRINEVKDLDEAIVADLEDIDIGGRKVDVIYNSYVLEHLEHPDRVLDSFNNLLKPGGLLILRLPDRNTVFGFVTRLTPFWLHVIYKKYVEGLKNAGEPGFAPYPVYYHEIVSRDGIRDFCESHGLTIREEIGRCNYCQRNTIPFKLVRVIAMIISAASFGRLPWRYNNLAYVIEKNK
jgi:SAM-dependent methyltransferase